MYSAIDGSSGIHSYGSSSSTTSTSSSTSIIPPTAVPGSGGAGCKPGVGGSRSSTTVAGCIAIGDTSPTTATKPPEMSVDDYLKTLGVGSAVLVAPKEIAEYKVVTVNLR